LAFLLGTKQEEYNDLLIHAKVFDNGVPPELLPVGRDPFGNLICLAVSGLNRGKVYWWFHEEEADEGEPPTYDNVYFVANSFSDLLDNLTESIEQMTLEALMSIVPPPKKPSDAGRGRDWMNIEKSLGTTLPVDYKDFINLYGLGLLSDHIWA
jgi:hypothetical protein